jgi:hypothetical protein
MLNGIIDRADGDEKKIRAELSTWFDNSMDRVSGAYKRWTQLWSFVLAFLIAAALNISTIDVAKQLWKQPIDAKAIAGVSDQGKLPDYLSTLDQMPIGWPSPGANPAAAANGADASTNVFAFFWRWPTEWGWVRIFGWLITAFATLFGAPFWFDLLQQIVRLKGSGPSPQEKAAGTGASA